MKKQNLAKSNSTAKYLKRIVSVLLMGVLLAALTACGASVPCESCGDTPTKAYMNTYYEEKEYYCADCSSDCEFCSGKAKNHYTSGLGIIIFVCDDCYEEIKSYNS